MSDGNMLSHILLTLAQSRIILSILVGGTLSSSSLMRDARISGSTWKKERALLFRMGLLSCAERRMTQDDKIRRVKFYSLTEKGNEVARHLRTIAYLLTRDQAPEISNPVEEIVA